MIMTPTLDRLQRRSVLFGGLAAAGCSSVPDISGGDRPIQNTPSLSQSVMLSGADEAGTHFASVRACQYPDAGVTWLWCTVATPQGLYQFYSNQIAWRGPPLTDPNALAATYRAIAPSARAEFERLGTLNAPQRTRLTAQFKAKNSNTGQKIPVALSATFEPFSGFAGLLPGRTEAFGRARFDITLPGKTIAFEGPAQFHEQTQTDARFVTPFVFASLWSNETCSTLLDAPPYSGGYVIQAGAPRALQTPVADLSLLKPKFSFKDGNKEGAIILDPVFSYQIPIYGRLWQGRYVRGEAFGSRVVGTLNSWVR